MLSRVGAYRPTEASFERFYRLQILVDSARDQVARAVVGAIADNRRHVRLPKRAALTALVAEAPRRFVEIALAGVPHQPQN